MQHLYLIPIPNNEIMALTFPDKPAIDFFVSLYGIEINLACLDLYLRWF